jgi:SAM-dependent methyltransferase
MRLHDGPLLRAARRRARRGLLAFQPLLRRGRLSVRAWRAWEAFLALAGRRRDRPADDDGLALPPAALRVRVIAQNDPDVFLRTGKAEAQALAAAARAYGLEVRDAGRLLDFGCGCGRVIRHWVGLPSLEVHGSDHDAELVDWLRTGLPFVHANRNELAPPLPYPAGHFGLVYAISVFTHMTEELTEAWMTELHRVLRPGGLLLFSVLAPGNLDRLLPKEREAFERSELVVQFAEGIGTNLCVTYHPEAYIERLTRDFERLGTRPVGPQELWIVRARGRADGERSAEAQALR